MKMRLASRPARTAMRRDGLTLVEFVILAVFLGILAMSVVPKLAPANTDYRLVGLDSNLRLVRSAIELYRAQHGHTNPSLESFTQQLTMRTSIDGRPAGTDKEETSLGPYLLAVPANPFTRSSSVGSGEPGTSAWYYNAASGEFRANDSVANRRR
jgi:competence protein ComGC